MKRAVEERLRRCKLEAHPDKTRIVYCRDSNRRQDAVFGPPSDLLMMASTHPPPRGEASRGSRSAVRSADRPLTARKSGASTPSTTVRSGLNLATGTSRPEATIVPQTNAPSVESSPIPSVMTAPRVMKAAATRQDAPTPGLSLRPLDRSHDPSERRATTVTSARAMTAVSAITMYRRHAERSLTCRRWMTAGDDRESDPHGRVIDHGHAEGQLAEVAVQDAQVGEDLDDHRHRTH